MSKILGLDLGTNSIGWALRDSNKEGNQIEKFGVITFNKGVGIGKTGEYSYAAQRTKKRSIRRLYQSRKYRLWTTLEHLITEGYCPLSIEALNKWRHYDKEEANKNNNGGRVYPVNHKEFDAWIKLDFDQDGKPDYSSPYQLRKELAEIQLDLEKEANRFKLGRALYHIAQRRGFKSSRKENEDTQEKTGNDDNEAEDLQYSEKKKNQRITDEFKKYPQAQTIGQLFALLESDNVRIRENIAQFAIRENYKDEIKYIFQTQQLNLGHPLYSKLVETAPNRNDGSIFFKRPLRSQKGLIGKCTLEPDKYRAPLSHPEFEKFRAWSFLNSIRYKPVGPAGVEWTNLPMEIKQEIYDQKFFRKSKPYFPFSEIAELLKAKGYEGEFNYKLKTSVTGCPVSARLRDIFGDNYQEVRMPKSKAPRSDKDFYNLDDLWHILFHFEDQESVSDFATHRLHLAPDQAKQFIFAWKALPVGYSMLSLKAIRKINLFLLKGLIYTEAVLLANIPEIIGTQIWKENEELLLQHISTIIQDNRDQKTILSIANNLIARHKNLETNEKYGYKDPTYQLDQQDIQDIYNAIQEQVGKGKWEKLPQDKKDEIYTIVKDCYQAYFVSSGLSRKDIQGKRHFLVVSCGKNFYKSDSGFYRMPKLIDTLGEFLQTHFATEDRLLLKLYHPSEINIYSQPDRKEDGTVKLPSPKTGSFKNPMAMRTLHELRKLINHLIEVNEIDSDTRIVVEVAREMNDANKRWAIEAWQRQREAENQEFAKAIEQLLQDEKGVKADPKNSGDIDKVRLFYEQNDEQTLPATAEITGEQKGRRKKNIDKDAVVRWDGLGKKLIDKYRLWKEQGYECMYTGKLIKISDLFRENIIDFEHTIPRSKSFDNSLPNLTVCFHDYNRTVKKNKIPTQLPNYEKDSGGNSAILPRLERWKEKVERIRQQIDFWKAKSQRASEKQWKDDAIRQRHLWQMELDYWKNKLDRFTMTEITSGFKNSQKVDTQLISKYAYHYLKTCFDKVDVQKGSITAVFRKIYGLQAADEIKNRTKHSHHAKDAAVLTLIPVAAKRDSILEKYYEAIENRTKFTETLPYKGFKREFIEEMDQLLLVNNITKNQALTPAKRKVRKRGKEQLIPGTARTKWATGSSVRGQLHQETFYGAIKPAKKGDKGNLLKKENGEFIQEEKIRYVIRVPFQYKKDANAQGFKTLDEIKKMIVDDGLKVQIEKQVLEAGGLKEAFDKGIYLLDKNGNPHGNRIRHIRVWASVSEPLAIKKQTNLSTKEYKQHYWASNGENILCAYYKNDRIDKNGKIKKNRELEIINLFEVARLKGFNLVTSDRNLQIFRKGKNNEPIFDKNGNKETPYVILTAGMKVIFYESSIEELRKNDHETNQEYKKRISDRTYRVIKFSGGQVTFQHHLDARDEKQHMEAFPEDGFFKKDKDGNELLYGKRGKNGFTEKIGDFELYNHGNPWHKLLYTKDWLDFAAEGKDFRVKISGEIEWI